MTEAFEDVREQANSRYYSYVQKHLSCRNYRNKPPQVVEPDMTVQVDTSTPVIRLTKKGPSTGSGHCLRRNGSDWSAAWLRFYRDLPLQAYSAGLRPYPSQQQDIIKRRRVPGNQLSLFDMAA